MQPQSHYLQCHDREIHFVEWGRKGAPHLILWHGLARTSRDFDELAVALADTYHIFCPDTIGRGYSQWSPAPDEEYCLAFYARIAQALIDQLGIESMRWVGTSMGGAIGTQAAASTLTGRISHLVLNDNGPILNPTALTRIRTYAGNPPEFDTLKELEDYLRVVYLPYGWLSDLQWRRMAQTSARRAPPVRACSISRARVWRSSRRVIRPRPRGRSPRVFLTARARRPFRPTPCPCGSGPAPTP